MAPQKIAQRKWAMRVADAVNGEGKITGRRGKRHF